MLQQVKSSDMIAETLRADICLSRDIEDGMLHEVALAQRFGVSRTPVRQALQRLAYERMIAVKSGVGSVVTPLDESKRADDICAAVAIIEAVAKCASAHAFFETRAGLLTTLAEMIENPILSDAFRAAYWRLIRWTVRDHAAASGPQIDHLRELLQSAARALKHGTLAEGFAQIAAIEGRLCQPS